MSLNYTNNGFKYNKYVCFNFKKHEKISHVTSHPLPIKYKQTT